MSAASLTRQQVIDAASAEVKRDRIEAAKKGLKEIYTRKAKALEVLKGIEREEEVYLAQIEE